MHFLLGNTPGGGHQDGIKYVLFHFKFLTFCYTPLYNVKLFSSSICGINLVKITFVVIIKLISLLLILFFCRKRIRDRSSVCVQSSFHCHWRCHQRTLWLYRYYKGESVEKWIVLINLQSNQLVLKPLAETNQLPKRQW